MFIKPCILSLFLNSFNKFNVTLAFFNSLYVCKYFQDDPTLTQYRAELITDAGRKLDKARMIRFDERTGYFACTDQGRIASHFYIKYDTVEVSIELT